MKKVLLFIAAVYSVNQLCAQELEYNTEVNRSSVIVRASLMTPGISMEKHFFYNLTLDINLWTNVYGYGNERGISSEISKNAMFTIEPRYYIELSENFSGIYFGMPLAVGLDRKVLHVAPVCGIQNEINNAMFWNIGLGYGFKQVDLLKSLGVVGYVSVGFTLL